MVCHNLFDAPLQMVTIVEIDENLEPNGHDSDSSDLSPSLLNFVADREDRSPQPELVTGDKQELLYLRAIVLFMAWQTYDATLRRAQRFHWRVPGNLADSQECFSTGYVIRPPVSSFDMLTALFGN
mmetsp:Transcript_14020/g.61114  ORF Transcript_14020/g.61114 Transcript_14020/m.61114 type:complete len:126 (+) Transcript_14020:417-794(+)